jgi:hypothetical protein
MLRIDTAGLARMGRDLQSLRRQVDFAQIVARTRTAQDVRRAEQAEMRRVFDRPKPWTLGSVYVKPATKRDPVATVWLKDDRAASNAGAPAAKYLAPQIEGGDRRAKAYERILQRSGYLPAGWVTAPGPAARLDAYGNISKGQITQVLSQLRTQHVGGYSSDLSRGTDARATRQRARALRSAGGRIFSTIGAEGRGRLAPGAYLRPSGNTRSAPQCILRYFQAANYERRFAFYSVAQRTIAARYGTHLDAALHSAIATARA